MRTDEACLPIKRLLAAGRNTASNDGLEEDEYMTPNLNQATKRYRTSVENTVDGNAGLDRYQEQLLAKIRVTQVACSD